MFSRLHCKGPKKVLMHIKLIKLLSISEVAYPKILSRTKRAPKHFGASFVVNKQTLHQADILPPESLM